MEIYVITNVENGWDCVCGAYTDIKKAIESRGYTYIEGKNNFDQYEESDWSPYIITTINLNT